MNRPSAPRLFSPLQYRGFWNEFSNGLFASFRCIVLFVSVVIVCFVPTTAICGLVLNSLSNLLLLFFF